MNLVDSEPMMSLDKFMVHDDKCEESGDSIIAVYFHGKLDFIPVDMKAQ